MVQCYAQGLDRTLGALADPNRRAILDRLADGPASITVLAAPLGMTLAGLLKHVRVLEGAELVVTHKTGRTRVCEVSPRSLDDLAAWIGERRRQWEPMLDRFAADVARQ